MVQRNINLVLAAIFSLITVILLCIATAGSSADYKPLTNIYIGRADISKINVTKVIPELENVVDVLGSVLYTYPNQTSLVFSGLRNLSHTSALLPFLTILINSKNNTQTIDAVNGLAPMALLASSSGVPAGSTKELGLISGLLSDSTNSTVTLQGLEDLIAAMGSNVSSSSSASSSDKLVMEILQKDVFTLLESSKNATATAEALQGITKLNINDFMQLMPALELLEDSTDPATTFQALHSLMNVTISPTIAESLFSQLSSVAGATGSKIGELISGASLILPASLDPAIDAVGSLLKSSKNTTESISLLELMIKNNITQSAVAKNVMTDLATIVNETKNQTRLFETLSTLPGSLGGDLGLSTLSSLNSSSAEVEQLTNILKVSNNTDATLEALQSLQTTMSSTSASLSSTTTKYIPYLFEFLKASSDPASSFNSLLNVTQFASKNLEYFTPVMKILELASKSTQNLTAAQLDNIIPIMFENLNIAPKLQLSIFTLCEVNSEGKVYKCNKPHAVQNFNFREIIYSVLDHSMFQPYLETLNIKANDLHLKGRLQSKQKEYVPAVKAVLAMNLLAIITGFSLAVALLMSTANKQGKEKNGRLSGPAFVVCSMLFCVLSGLGAAIITAMVNIIKRDTALDDYNVSVEYSPAYFGLVWTAFCLTVFTVVLVISNWLFFRGRSTEETSVGSSSAGSSGVYRDEKDASVESFESMVEVDVVHADSGDSKVKALDA